MKISELKELLCDFNVKDYKIIKNQFLELHINHKKILDFMVFLRDNVKLKFTILTDLFAVDFPNRDKRFEIVYNLLSLHHNTRLLLKLHIEENVIIDTISSIYKCADWYEREIYDLFGIKITGLKNNTRLLTDYNFIGHPLRKDFPLSGYSQVKYDINKEEVSYEPVKLDQNYRNFNTISPWKKNPLEKEAV